MLWIIPPYSEMIENAPLANSPVGLLERRLFRSLTPDASGFGARRVRNYIDWLGAHQYWDFFAPEIPRVHRYLEVCSDILEISESQRIECIDPLYQSFDGTIDQAELPHRGNASRSCRLVENPIRLNRPDLLDAFTRYWSHRKFPNESRTTFLLLHEFTLQPGAREIEPANLRH
ncbi:MAG: hypothetical protein ACRERS_08975, partial [Methylococcales bacterium]